jgi:hypothetical protein
VNDRDGLYVAVTPAGLISFRYNYAIHGRQEPITFGRYSVGGIIFAEARERLGEGKKMIAAGNSPAKETAGQGPYQGCEDVRGLGGEVVARLAGRRVLPLQTVADHVDDSAYDLAVVNPGNAMRKREKRCYLRHLALAQQK